MGLLQIVLIILKALGCISWSWWLVLLPLIILGFIALAILIAAIVIMIRNKKQEKEYFNNLWN